MVFICAEEVFYFVQMQRFHEDKEGKALIKDDVHALGSSLAIALHSSCRGGPLHIV